MSTIKISPFLGMVPRTSDRSIPDGMAVLAENVNLTSGDIRPLRAPKLYKTTLVITSAYRAESGGSEKWLLWDIDVDAARAPLSSDVEQRYYWTGDGEPGYATFTNIDSPSTNFSLGVPKPTIVPSVTHSGGSGSVVTRFYRYTFMSVLAEESAPSAPSVELSGRIDGTWAIGAITAMQGFPLSSGAGTAVYGAPDTTFTNGSAALHWLRAGDQVVISATTLTVLTTPTSASFTVAGDYSAATAWARKKAWNTASMTRNLYRTTGSSGAWQLVAEAVGTTYNDTLLDSAILGDDLLSESWDLPPAGLKGIGALPSGAMYGFVGSLICFSEPFQPHAWPASYQLGTDYEIVGNASFGSTLIVATKGTPYIVDGVEPASATAQRVDMNWPCLSKRSVCSVGDGVIYATNYGLAYIGQSGPRMFTDQHYTTIEWEVLNPETMYCAANQGRIHVSYQTDEGLFTMLVFNTDGALTTASLHSLLLYSDPRDGMLYVSGAQGLYQYAENTGLGQAWSWRSKTWFLPPPINFAAARVDFEGGSSAADTAAAAAQAAVIVAANAVFIAGYDFQGGFGGSAFGRGPYIGGSGTTNLPATSAENLTFTLFVGGTVLFSGPVYSDQKSFRLPSGYLADTVAVLLSGNVSRVHSVKLAGSMMELRDV